MGKQDPLNALKQDPQAASLLSDPSALSTLLGSKEAKTMAHLLQTLGGDHLQQAAQAAVSGSPEALRDILSKVAENKEGKAAMEALEKRGKR